MARPVVFVIKPDPRLNGSVALEQVQELAVQLVALEVFVLDVAAVAVQDAERAAEVPHRPAPAGLLPVASGNPRPSAARRRAASC